MELTISRDTKTWLIRYTTIAKHQRCIRKWPTYIMDTTQQFVLENSFSAILHAVEAGCVVVNVVVIENVLIGYELMSIDEANQQSTLHCKMHHHSECTITRPPFTGFQELPFLMSSNKTNITVQQLVPYQLQQLKMMRIKKPILSNRSHLIINIVHRSTYYGEIAVAGGISQVPLHSLRVLKYHRLSIPELGPY